jgi:hypothetical protein
MLQTLYDLDSHHNSLLFKGMKGLPAATCPAPNALSPDGKTKTQGKALQ